MDKEAQRIALAEFCGWTLEQTNVHDGKCWHLNGIQSEDAPPDYLNDLNAVHEVEKKLSPVQWNLYSHYLEVVTRNPLDPAFRDGWQDINCSRLIDALLIHSTAAQRCEAILRTLGRWE